MIKAGPYSDDEADDFVREQTGGEVYIDRTGGGARLCRKGFELAIALHPNWDKEPDALARALEGWQDWPDPRR